MVFSLSPSQKKLRTIENSDASVDKNEIESRNSVKKIFMTQPSYLTSHKSLAENSS